MLTALILLMGGVNGAWAASDLTTSFEVIGYKAAHLLDFQNKNYDGTAISSFDELPGLGVTAQNTVGSTYGSNNWYDNTSDGRGLRLQSGGGRWIQFTIDIKADDYIIINGGAASEAYEITMTDGTSTIIASASDYLCFKANKDLSALKLTVHRYNYITQILIMTKDATASTADYTINYILGSETVKTSNGNAAIGSTVATDASFFVDDVKYIRVDDEAESFDIAASNNVFTVKVREAETYSYSLLSSLGATLNTGSGYEGETVAVGYPRYQLEGTTLYESAVTNKEYRKAIELTSNNVSTIVDYSQKVENVVFYTEAEMINGMTISTKDNIPVRASNALAAVASEDVEITTLPIGKYTIHAGVFTSKSDNFESVNFGIGAKTFEAMTASNLNEVASDEYTLTISTSVKYLGTTSWADGQFDYIWIEKTGDLTQEEILLADAKDKAQNAIDFANMLKNNSNGLSETQIATLDGYIAELEDILNTEEATVDEVKVMNDNVKSIQLNISNLRNVAQTNVYNARQDLQTLINEAEGAYEDGKVGSEELATAIADANAAAQAGIYNDMLAAAVTLREKLDAYIAANTETGVVYYVKVTDTDDITDGDYLIVYEDGNVAFNGSLTTLDKTENGIAVSISENKIEGSESINAATFTIDVTNGTIKSASGLYIGVESTKNVLSTSEDATKLTNSFEIDGDDNAVISTTYNNNTKTLRYNAASDQLRFRYFGSGQEPVSLYKKVVGGEEPPTSITVATPTFSPVGGEYTEAQTVTLACETEEATIYYTTNGDTPTTESTQYTESITVSETTTIKAIAVYKGVPSEVAEAIYTIKAAVVPTGDVYYVKVTDTDDITDGEYLIVYEDGNVAFNGSLKTLDATNNGIEVSISDNKIEGSDPINAATFTIDVTNGTIKSASGLYIGVEEDKNVLSTSEDATKFTNSFEIGEDDNAVISTTYNNNTKTLRYNAASDQLRFRYFGSGQQPIALYKKVTPAPVITVAAPTFSPEGGEYTEAQTVTLNCETEGATIYYTTNGDTPTADSTPYNAEEPITVSETTTIKAIAVLNGVESKVAEATYTIIPPVTDLTITGVTLSHYQFDISDNSKVNYIEVVYKNVGETSIANFNINYYKNDDTEPFFTMVDVVTDQEGPLAPGDKRTVGTPIENHIKVPGIYTIRAEVVAENDVNSENNVRTVVNPVTLYVKGDANVNGEVTTSDAVAAVSYALEKITPDELQMLSADVDKTNNITVADAQAIVNIALNYEFESEARGAEAGVNYLTMENSGIGLVNTTGFSAFQMDVTLSDGAVLNAARLTERAAGMLLMTNKVGLNTWRIAALSLDGSTISGSEGSLLNLDIAGQGSVSVSNVEFVDRAARAYKLGLGTPTAIDALYNNKVDGEVYTVSGARSNGLKKGVNVVRQADGSVRKMLVK